MNKPISWHEAYSILVNLLCDFYRRYEDRSGAELFVALMSDKNFRSENKWSQKFSSHWDVGSFDPLHIFASFNYTGLSNYKRTEKLKYYIKHFAKNLNRDQSIEFDIDDYDGVPAPILFNIVSARNIEAQQEIWEFFYWISDSPMNRSRNDLYARFSDLEPFERMNNWYGIGTASLTMFLFWINSKDFIALDDNTANLLLSNHIINSIPKHTVEYIALLKKLPEENKDFVRNVVKVSYSKHHFEQLTKTEQREIEGFLNFTGEETIQSTVELLYSMEQYVLNPIAIKPLKKCSEEHIKTLQHDEMYYFTDKYNIEDDIATTNNSEDFQLFNFDGVNVNINALVGTNGAGKSTIIELFVAAINNIAKYLNKELEIIPVTGIYLDIYIQIGQLYKFEIRNTKIGIFPFEKHDDKLVCRRSKAPLSQQFKLENFFYTIFVNYSLHALNSRTMGDWIHHVFHKNDAYQTPLLIEPFRKTGNIDINDQNQLAKARLLSNLLEKSFDEKDVDFRRLTEYLSANEIELTLNSEKVQYVRLGDGTTIQLKDIDNENVKGILQQVYKQYSIDEIAEISFESKKIENICNMYIVKKVISILLTYPHYKKYLSNRDENPGLSKTDYFDIKPSFYKKLYEDTSHITYKLKQAINFIKYRDSYDYIENLINHGSTTVDIDLLADSIEKIKIHHKADEHKTIDLLPPSFIEPNIFLADENHKHILFDHLSSGEKQRIYLMQSLIYHLTNICSVSNELVAYHDVNVILDEIELYYHPEMQRTFINDLLENLKQTRKYDRFESLRSLNLLFVTHSPFILSDILASNVLLLEKERNEKTKPRPVNFKTFGANIHELLANGFFFQGNKTIGEFAFRKVREIIEFYNRVNDASDNQDELSKEYAEKRDLFWFIQSNIGEDYISTIVKNHLEELDNRLTGSNDDDIDKQIEEHKRAIERLNAKKSHR